MHIGAMKTLTESIVPTRVGVNRLRTCPRGG